MDVELEVIRFEIERLRDDRRSWYKKIDKVLPFLTRLQNDLGNGNWVADGAVKIMALLND